MVWRNDWRGIWFLGLAAGLALFHPGLSPAAELAGRRPNIIFVITDDQGYGDLSCNGNPVLRTPHIDRLHHEGVRFRDFHVSPTCAPTRAALLTGRHEFRNGVTHTVLERERLTLAATTLPQILKSAGYRTGIFGKWHQGDEPDHWPDKRGFDEMFIHGAGGIGQSYPGSCGDAPGNTYFDPAILHNGKFEKTRGYCTDVFFQQATRWIEDVKGTQPFFCYIATNAPHDPYQVRHQDVSRYEDLVPEAHVARFFGMIANIDDNVGRLLARLQEWQIDRDTLVVFMNDNGGTSGVQLYNAGMRGQKGSAWLGGTRASSLWRWPGTLEPATVDRLCAHIDLLPTLAEIAGAPLTDAVTRQVEGRSLVPLLTNPQADWPARNLFTHVGRWPKGTPPADYKYRACSVRAPRWHLVSEGPRNEKAWQLFDVQADPGEQTNVAAQHPDVVAELDRAYDAWWASVQPQLVNEAAPGPAINPFRELYEQQFPPAQAPRTGWRGNGTGLWPDARAPFTWQRLSRGVLSGARTSAQPPANPEAPGTAPALEKGLLRDWLVLGPFPVGNSLADFASDPLGGGTVTGPAAGQMVDGREWTAASTAADDISVFGTAELPWLDLTKSLPIANNQLAYAHTYLFAPRAGQVRVVVEHSQGLQMWCNGKQVYQDPQRQMTYGFYFTGSRQELDHAHQPAPRITLDLQAGWNRLLLKLSSGPQGDSPEMRCCLRIMDLPESTYETRNIRWMTELRGRSTSTPLLVGDRIFVLAEPDELMCLDKHSGKVLWVQRQSAYEALTDSERQSLPGLAPQVEPLLARLRDETDAVARLALRRELQTTLRHASEDLFSIQADGHFEAHFGIVGFTMPTPVTDGRLIYVWNGAGIAACYDLDGRRHWITRIKGDHLTYGACPALIDGVLGIFMGELVGVAADTGQILWRQHRVRRNIGAVLAARVHDRAVFVSQPGEILDAKTGELLHRPRGYSTSDTGWSPPVILDQRWYVPRYGVMQLKLYDFAAPDSSLANPFLERQISLPEEAAKFPDGRRVDRWTAGSPLIWEGLAYVVDIYQWLYVIDLATGHLTHHAPLALEGFMHYNSVPVAASPTLVGSHIVICDNQGTAVVLEPGAVPRQVARNRIETQLDRFQPLPAQETLTYAPPLCDGDRLYLRGERYLYCIGKD